MRMLEILDPSHLMGTPWNAFSIFIPRQMERKCFKMWNWIPKSMIGWVVGTSFPSTLVDDVVKLRTRVVGVLYYWMHTLWSFWLKLKLGIWKHVCNMCFHVPTMCCDKQHNSIKASNKKRYLIQCIEATCLMQLGRRTPKCFWKFSFVHVFLPKLFPEVVTLVR